MFVFIFVKSKRTSPSAMVRPSIRLINLVSGLMLNIISLNPSDVKRLVRRSFTTISDEFASRGSGFGPVTKDVI